MNENLLELLGKEDNALGEHIRNAIEEEAHKSEIAKAAEEYEAAGKIMAHGFYSEVMKIGAEPGSATTSGDGPSIYQAVRDGSRVRETLEGLAEIAAKSQEQQGAEPVVRTKGVEMKPEELAAQAVKDVVGRGGTPSEENVKAAMVRILRGARTASDPLQNAMSLLMKKAEGNPGGYGVSAEGRLDKERETKVTALHKALRDLGYSVSPEDTNELLNQLDKG